MRLVVATTFATWPPRDGASLRNFHLYRAIASRHPVDLLVLAHRDAEPLDREIAPGLREIRIPACAAQAAAEASITAGVDVPAWDIATADLWPLAREYRRRLGEACAGADLLVASHPYLVAALRDASSRPMVYEAPDVEVDLKRAALPDSPAGRDLLGRVRIAEATACREAALVVACTAFDGARFRDHYGVPAERIACAPNGADAAGIPFVAPDLRRASRQAGRVPTALFMGSLHGPNIAAAGTILDLAGSRPAVRFVIAGSVGRALQDRERPPNVVVTGDFEPEARDALLRDADLALNPVTSGSGSHLKLMECFAAGLPVISTPHGARGFEAQDGIHLLVRPLEAFGPAIDALLADAALAQRLAAAARAGAEGPWSWEASAEAVLPALESLGRRERLATKSARRVSILVPMRDAEPWIDECLGSALASTWSELEIIVVDDGSRDASARHVAAWIARDTRVRMLRHEDGANRGVARSLELALAHATGERTAFLDADDAFEPDKLERQMAFLDRHPQAVLCHTGVRVVGEGEAARRAGSHFAATRAAGLYDYLGQAHALERCDVLNSSVLASTAALRAIDFTAPQHFQSEDWLVVALLGTQGPFAWLPEPLTRYRVHPRSYSSRVLGDPLGRFYATLEFLLALRGRIEDERMGRRVDEALERHVGWGREVYARSARRRLLSAGPTAEAVRSAVSIGAAPGVAPEFGEMPATLSVTVENRGPAALTSEWPHPAHLSYHWLDAASRGVVEWDGRRSRIEPALGPGARGTYRIRIEPPPACASQDPLVLRVTLVQEGRFWLDDVGGAYVDFLVRRGERRR